MNYWLLLAGVIIAIFAIVSVPMLHNHSTHNIQYKEPEEPVCITVTHNGYIDISCNWAPTTASGRPVPFDKIAEKVPLSIVVSQWEKRGLDLYLPTKLPKGLEFRAVWAKVKNGTVGNTIIMVFDRSNNTNIRGADLTIEIEPIPMPWHIANFSRDHLVKIGNWTVFITEKAPIDEPEYYKKFGTHYCNIVDVEINGLNYQFCVSPAVQLNDVLQMIGSMKPVGN